MGVQGVRVRFFFQILCGCAGGTATDDARVKCAHKGNASLYADFGQGQGKSSKAIRKLDADEKDGIDLTDPIGRKPAAWARMRRVCIQHRPRGIKIPHQLERVSFQLTPFACTASLAAPTSLMGGQCARVGTFSRYCDKVSCFTSRRFRSDGGGDFKSRRQRKGCRY